MQPAPLKTMTGTDWALLILLAGVWGLSYIMIEVTLKSLPIMAIVCARLLLAAVVLLGVARVMDVKLPRSPRLWLSFSVMGLLNTVVPFTLIVWAQQQIDAGLAAILNATTPLFTVVVAHFFTRDESFTPRKIVGVVLGIIGVTIIIGPDALHGLRGNALAQLASLAAALCYAFGGVYGRRFRDLKPILPSIGQAVTGGLILLPFMLVLNRPWELPAPPMAVIAAVATLAVVCTAMAYLVYFRILASAGATNVLLVTFLIPVSAIILGWLFLDEVLLPRHFAGMGMIAGGLAVMDGRVLGMLRRMQSSKSTPPPP